ncbi:MAG: L-lactate permease [Deltaproteobacteria bacterium]|nr:L-lactate permease [Deltaproteobacteria bacterium]
MDYLLFFAAASPVLLIAALVICWKMSALGLSVWGILFTAVIASTVFHTSLTTILMGALDGLITTLPLLLTVFLGIILSVLLIGTEALSRIVNGLSKGFRGPMHQVNGICFGIENFVAGAGIITEPIIAPTLKAIGLPAKDAAILSIWGYSGIMSFTLAGVFVVILSNVTGLDLQKLAVITAIISIIPTLVFGVAIPLVMEKREITKGHRFFNISTAFACGIMTLCFVIFVSSSTACMLAGLGVLGGIILLSRSRPDFSAIKFADIAPFLILIVALSVVNMYPPLRTIAGEKLVFSLSVVPVHIVKIRPLMDAYTYLTISIAVTIWGLKITKHQFVTIAGAAMPRALRAIVAMMIFGAMGQIIALTGYEIHSDSMVTANNIPYVLASGLSKLSGKYYPVFAPLLGWAGTFLTGYGSLSVMIFGKLQVEIARFINLSPEVLASAMMVGSGIGSISSPFKVAMATSLVDAVGKEGDILRKTIPIGVAISLITGIWSYVLLLTFFS